ncbi:Methyltransferase domain-containing protein [Tranquillimonas rosea]|uniref:Methyltransferase domain-containing protein n=1 Tax=Tranquillimonas rosea TaxID=641238 RepID=A0A1H9TQL9_9RHOB|nr:class I SAM-dependent methyltransferase [Tranquillimonas rosea]SER98923.1 Methyltransferase domain-containing protein [Tranquillimonas rosea]
MDWDARFSSPDFVFGTEPAAFLRRHAGRFAAPSRILAVADGEGRNSVWLAEQGHDVTAWDGSANAIAKACGLAEARGVTVDFHVADAESYPWPEAAFDAVVGVFIQFAGPDPRDAMFAGMIHATRPGGHVLLHGYTPKQLEFGTGGPPRVENLYTEEMLRAAFAPYGEIEVLDSYEADIREGAGHAGRSALIDLVLRREAT